jgi:hypothetical protein
VILEHQPATSLAVAIAGLIGSSFWNSGTTIAVHVAAAIVACGSAAAPVVVGLLRYWFRTREDLPDVPDWNLKHDSPGQWVLAGLGLALFSGLLFAWCGYLFASVATQHLSGRRLQVPAKVMAIERVYGRRRNCDRRARFSAGSDGELESCVKPFGNSPLMDDGIRVGDRVTLLIVENVLGSALVGVVPKNEH